jgi:hypothetical protein
MSHVDWLDSQGVRNPLGLWPEAFRSGGGSEMLDYVLIDGRVT